MKAGRGTAIPRCSVCNRPSVIRLRDPDRHLCNEHFCSDLTDRVKTRSAGHGMIAHGDRIAAAFSGGKDSTALLLLLREILPEKEGVTLMAITVDEGIAGYREETIRTAVRLTSELSIEHRIVSFSDIFGKNLDEILAGREERACSFCGILRRKALTLAARDTGATKIATGHNLDDEAQSVLMNTLRGDLTRLVRSSGSRSGGCFLPRIKPLRGISEKEIAIYLMVRGYFSELPECPYTRYAYRANVRTSLSRFEFLHPGTMRNLERGKEKLTSVLAGIPCKGEIGRCMECGDSCSGTICQTCLLLKRILDQTGSSEGN